MKLCVRVVVAFLLCSSLALLGPGCAPDSGLADGEEVSREQAALSVPFEVLPFTKSAAPAGITVIKNKAQFKAFFGVSAPGDLTFIKSWVVHYSLGIQNTGGYKAEITGVERTGFGATKLLTVHTRSVSPGPACMVTMALTNPQVTVKIPRQAAQIPVEQVAEHELTDCSEPNWCAVTMCPMGTFCDESVDTCREDAFCPKVKCANGYQCDEAARACVPRLCDPTLVADCPDGFACENQIVCITTPCPAEYRCIEQKGNCGDVTYEGQCDDNTLQYCLEDELQVIPCGGGACGWDSEHSYYDCL